MPLVNSCNSSGERTDYDDFAGLKIVQSYSRRIGAFTSSCNLVHRDFYEESEAKNRKSMSRTSMMSGI